LGAGGRWGGLLDRFAAYGHNHVGNIQDRRLAHGGVRLVQLFQMAVGLGIVARHGVDGSPELLSRLLGMTLPGQQHAQVVVGLAGAGGRLEMLPGFAQPALAHEHHSQVVMGQLEVGIQTHRALEGLLGPGQIVGQEIGHAQVVLQGGRAGLQLYGPAEALDGFLRLSALVIENAQSALGAP
jgi:hypothetical protein